jgi:hypothetical protein
MSLPLWMQTSDPGKLAELLLKREIRRVRMSLPRARLVVRVRSAARESHSRANRLQSPGSEARTRVYG